MAGEFVIRTRKFITNPLLSRKQFIVDVYHQEIGFVSGDKIQEAVAKKFKVDKGLVVIYGQKTKFGGGKTQAFCLIYNSADAQKKFEPKYRLIRQGVVEKEKVKKARRTKKEDKNKKKKIRGTAKVKGVVAKKKK